VGDYPLTLGGLLLKDAFSMGSFSKQVHTPIKAEFPLVKNVITKRFKEEGSLQPYLFNLIN
jgi:hypothetical protein